jgi:hypothetical protein
LRERSGRTGARTVMSGSTSTSTLTKELEVTFTNIFDARKSVENGMEAMSVEGEYLIE